jgi:hypothetical protein
MGNAMDSLTFLIPSMQMLGYLKIGYDWLIAHNLINSVFFTDAV